MEQCHHRKHTFQNYRIFNSYSIRAAAQAVGITNEDLISYERDSGNMPCRIAAKLCLLYGIPTTDLIHIGKALGD